ncbi:hypothetical protein [Streptomyces sp. NPDC088141]|uniref:hypothetical protein n=2 Tax=Streptomyces TaxID=1883 RepID=UPI003425EF09
MVHTLLDALVSDSGAAVDLDDGVSEQVIARATGPPITDSGCTTHTPARTSTARRPAPHTPTNPLRPPQRTVRRADDVQRALCADGESGVPQPRVGPDALPLGTKPCLQGRGGQRCRGLGGLTADPGGPITGTGVVEGSFPIKGGHMVPPNGCGEVAFTMKLTLDGDWNATVTGDPLRITPRFCALSTRALITEHMDSPPERGRSTMCSMWSVIAEGRPLCGALVPPVLR